MAVQLRFLIFVDIMTSMGNLVLIFQDNIAISSSRAEG
jgi:hypothetical protein